MLRKKQEASLSLVLSPEGFLRAIMRTCAELINALARVAEFFFYVYYNNMRRATKERERKRNWWKLRGARERQRVDRIGVTIAAALRESERGRSMQQQESNVADEWKDPARARK